MHAAVDVQPLKDAVELVHGADEVAVHVDFGLARLDLEPEQPLLLIRAVPATALRVVGGIAAVPRVVIAAVVTAVARAVPPRIVGAAVVAAGNDHHRAATRNAGDGAPRNRGAGRFMAVARTRVVGDVVGRTLCCAADGASPRSAR